MSMNTNHTRTPWLVTMRANENRTIRGGEILPGANVPPAIAKMVGRSKFHPQVMADAVYAGDHDREANAAFIVRACNAHEALVESLKGLVGYCGDMELSKRLEQVLDSADAALKLARGDA